MHEQKEVIGGFSTSDYYWSSSEISETQAWVQGFGSSVNQIASNKNNATVRVRAIRVF